MPVLPPRPRREPKLRKHPRSGFYSAVFYDRDRQPLQKWVSLETATRRAAERRFEPVAAAYLAATFDPWRDRWRGSGTTLARAAEEYQAFKARDWRPQTAENEGALLKRFVDHLPAGVLASAVTAADVERWVSAPPQESRPGHSAALRPDRRAASTRRKYYATLLGLFTWAVETRVVEHNVAADVERPAREPTRIVALTPDEVRGILTALDRDVAAKRAQPRNRLGIYDRSLVWFGDVVRLGVLTGLRPSELHRLRWQDVRLDRRVLLVRSTDRGQVKTASASRPVPLVSPAVALLCELAARRRTEDPSEPVLPSPRPGPGGAVRPFSVQVAGRLFRRYVADAGVTSARGRVTLYALRRSCATWLADAGVSMEVIQEILGHARIETTRQFYADVFDERKLAEAERALGRLDLGQ